FPGMPFGFVAPGIESARNQYGRGIYRTAAVLAVLAEVESELVEQAGGRCDRIENFELVRVVKEIRSASREIEWRELLIPPVLVLEIIGKRQLVGLAGAVIEPSGNIGEAIREFDNGEQRPGGCEGANGQVIVVDFVVGGDGEDDLRADRAVQFRFRVAALMGRV